MLLTREQLLVLGVTGLVVFWVVGAHNRLVGLRNDIGAAWSRLSEALAQRSATTEPWLAALRETLAAEASAMVALDVLQSTLRESARATVLMSARPMSADHAQAWTAAEAAVSAAASRVLALLQQHPALKEGDAVAAGLQGWHELSARLGFARQMYNETASSYDEAVSLFPTRLLVRLFRFSKAGRL